MLWEDTSLPAMKTGVFFAWACAPRLDKEHATSDSDPWCIEYRNQILQKRPLLAMNSLYNEKGQWPVPMVRKENIHAVCCEDNYFPKGKFKLYNSLLHSVYLVFSIRLFSIANFFCRALSVGRIYVTRINAVSWHIGRHSRRLLIGLFNWLVYVHTYCLPIATLNQNKRSRLLYLGDAQIIKGLVLQNFDVVSVRDVMKDENSSFTWQPLPPKN